MATNSENESPKDTVLDLIQDASMNIEDDSIKKQQKKRVLVIGTVGVGKTSLINMLANKPALLASSTAIPKTIDIQRVSIIYEDVEYEFIDTPGLNGALNPDDRSKETIANLFVFLGEKKESIDCVLFVRSETRIDEAFDRSASVFKERLIQNHVPFILVVTGREMDEDLEGTQVTLDRQFQKYNFDKIICGTTMQGGDLENIFFPIREQMKIQLWSSIAELCHKPFHNATELSNGNQTEEQVSSLWAMIKTIIDLFTSGVYYGAHYGVTGVQYGAYYGVKGVRYGAAQVYNLYEYAIIGRNGQELPARVTDIQKQSDQGARELPTGDTDIQKYSVPDGQENSN